jgi:general secretion pathway protein G
MHTKDRQTRFARRSARAFTLIELLLVLVILAVLAAVVVPRFTGRSEQARQTAAKTDIANIKLALNIFEQDCGRFPSNEEGLRALMEAPGGVQEWHGPYLESMPTDPWGREYVYRYPGVHNTRGFDLFSLGPDGREGSNNITNWDK